jgi:hypothetical protein
MEVEAVGTHDVDLTAKPQSHGSPAQRRESWRANLACSGPLDLRAQGALLNLLRSDTPKQFRTDRASAQLLFVKPGSSTTRYVVVGLRQGL